MACAPGDHADITTRFCPHCGEQLAIDPVRIENLQTLLHVYSQIGVRPDWHEPDEQKVAARVRGWTLDNAGFWPNDTHQQLARQKATELYVELIKEDKVVAQVNLATLFAIACRTIR
jgi:hypothetical protein